MANSKNERVLMRLDQHLREHYGNNTAPIVAKLDNALFMLFFLQDDAFPSKEVQQTAYALKMLRDVLAEDK
jgi:hypothetical protein